MLSLKSPAKVNLALDILERDSSGYHQIQTIYQEVPTLFDELEIAPSNNDAIELNCLHPEVPIDNSNTIWEAARLLKKYAPKRGVHITLHKNIPVQAGLGGASSNAAATLKALNELWELNLPQEELLKIAAEIGMDVPFFILGGTALGTHYGERILPLKSAQVEIQIIQTGIRVPTQNAYESLDLTMCGKHQNDTHRLMEQIQNGDRIDLALIHNDFEIEFFQRRSELKKEHPGAHLAGSGGCLFKVD